MKLSEFFLLKAAFENTSDAISIADLSGRHIYQNRRFKELFGYEKEEVQKKGIANLFEPPEIFEEEIFPTISRGLSWEGEVLVKRKDEKKLPCYLRASAIKDEEGNIIGFIGIHTDISAQKEMERRLRESEQMYRSLVEKSLLGIYLIQDGVLKFANQRLAEILGYTVEEIIGKSPLELTHPDDRPMVKENICRRIRGEVESIRYNFRGLRKDGKAVYVEVFGSAMTYKGRPAIHGMLLDITEKCLAEERAMKNWKIAESMADAALRYLETRDIREIARLIVDKCLEIGDAEVGFAAEITGDGRIRVIGLSERSITPQAWHDFFSQSIQVIRERGYFEFTRKDSILYRVVEEGHIFICNREEELKARCTLPEGHPPIKSLLLLPLKFERRVIGLIGLANRPGGFGEKARRELEAFATTASLIFAQAKLEQEKRTVEEQLFHAQKMEELGKLAAGVAHDFNNILMVIQGNMDLLKSALPPRGQVKEYVEEIDRAIKQASFLTGQLLTFSRKQVVKPAPLDLNSLIVSFKGMLSRLLGEKYDLKLSLEEGLWEVRADRKQIEQVLFNLVVNAKDAMPEGGEVLIKTFNQEVEEGDPFASKGVAEGKYAVIAVKDHGVGMSEEVMKRIFQPFFTTKRQGTGLGLAIVKSIVQQSRGFVVVESWPGKGSIFYVLLPRAGNPA